jgi:hypothetical protein
MRDIDPITNRQFKMPSNYKARQATGKNVTAMKKEKYRAIVVLHNEKSQFRDYES